MASSTFEYGDLFETFIVNEFFKLIESYEKRWRLSYLRTKSNVEIDLIIEKPRGAPILVEIKSANQIKSDDVQSYIEISKEFPKSEKYVFSNMKKSFEHNGVVFIHWQDGLSRIFAEV